MENKIKHHLSELKQFDSQRRKWLVLSAFVVIAMLGVIFNWPEIHQYRLEWAMGSVGGTLAVFWWYWTMRMVRRLLEHKIEEHQVLYEVILEIRSVKVEILDQFRPQG